MIKKFLSILMAVIMTFSVAQIAFAAGGAVYDEETGLYTENGFVYWVYDDEDFGGVYIIDYVGTDDTIYIPKTLGGDELVYWDIESSLFSATDASAFSVDADNENFSVKDGVLFSKDGTVLLAYPNGKAGDSYDIPEGVEELGYECFFYSSLKEVTFPSTLEYVCSRAFGDSFDDFFAETDGLIYSGNTLINYSSYHIPDVITVKDGTEKIEEYALPYSGCIVIPDSVTEIGEQDFDDYLCGSEGSAAQKFAEENNIEFIVLGEGHVHNYFLDYSASTEATCVSTGKGVFICPCGEKYEVELEIDPYAHVYEYDDICIYCGKSYWEDDEDDGCDCDCKCHSLENSYAPSFDGIFSFLSDLFFRLKLVFWHFTGTHQYCECGRRHY